MRNIEKAIYHTTIIILIGVTLYLLIYFFFPIKHGMFADGGTKYWEARVYTLIKWNELDHVLRLDDGKILSWTGKKGWNIYWYPNQDAWEDVEIPSMDTFPYEEYASWLKEHGKEIPYTNYEEYIEWSKYQNS